MAATAQERGLPPELPVMASLVEAGLKNHAGGDRDSVGLFQMRTSIWNKGRYEGYPNRPGLQLRWFLDRAETVRSQRVAAGLGVHDPRHYGDWIADIERPAEQYRGRYQLRLLDARALLEQAGHGSKGSAHLSGNEAGVFPAVDPHTIASDGLGQGVRAGVVESAVSFVGTPYVWGGTSPRGFDCSGFVQYVYKQIGIELPRVSYQQADSGRRIPLSALKAGDLVAWDNSSRNPGADHIAIYLGRGRIAEAPRPGVELRIRKLGSNEGAWGVRVLERERLRSPVPASR
jgi:cell wall-associated NlpC family hydrolase